ncbi:MAG: hypothetical protein VZT48_12895 [Bulleidia sp.]|nr:hypothetical protein [Bulleidia sp.]
MAERPVFVSMDHAPYVLRYSVQFEYAGGFALVQSQKNITRIHEAYMKTGRKEPLEISSKSMQPVGIRLSAFHLLYDLNGKKIPVENIFQAGKTFVNGGPYLDLLGVTPKEAKRDERLRTSGALRCFTFERKEYPLIPRTAFYNWIWINALLCNPDLVKEIEQYDSFTDVAFNPVKSLNCQAEAAAVYTGLKKAGKLEEAMASFDSFVNILG